MSTRLLGLATEHRAALAKHSSLMCHWFYSMIGLGREAQIQEGNSNVV
jgi:hypothetical protein